ncbi:MAG: Ku protein [Bdellovibrionales bacterium]|nr:Ku protein [Bdellovibrionales bacterium]
MWKGTISFGLVSIPVYLESSKETEKIHFNLIDKRDNAPVGYKQINKNTRREIERKDIVKGYEYEKGEYVIMSEADFKKANVKATGTMEIEDFVELSEVDPILFDKPYYIVPQKGGEKGYVLLRDVLKRTDKAGVCTVVLHTVQHLALLIAREDYILLELLRFSHEIRELHEVDFLDPEIKKIKVSDRELKVAEQVVHGMTGKWQPDKYRDTYQDDLMKLIKAKVRKGATTTVEEVATEEEDEVAPNTNVIDLTALLEKSLNAAKGKGSRRKTSSEKHA